jgi:hypothetical protein
MVIATLVADAKKSILNIGPIAAEDIGRNIAGLFELKPVLIARPKDVLYNE